MDSADLRAILERACPYVEQAYVLHGSNEAFTLAKAIDAALSAPAPDRVGTNSKCADLADRIERFCGDTGSLLLPVGEYQPVLFEGDQLQTILAALRRPAEASTQGWQVPKGWKLVPVEIEKVIRSLQPAREETKG